MQHLPEALAPLIRELISYDPDTGLVKWCYRDRDLFIDDRSFNTWNKRFSNKIAGSKYKHKKAKTPYIKIRILNNDYKIHTIIYFYVTGVWCTEIDHIDGDGLNNRFNNLRPATKFINSRNRSKQVNNTTGYTGVARYIKTNKYQAYINDNNGKRLHLGLYSYINDAIIARAKAEIKYNYHKNHGRTL